MEFKHGEANIRSFPQVRKALAGFIDDYEERFGQYNDVFEAWHQLRVQVLDNFGRPDYLKTSRDLTEKFLSDYFKDPNTGKHLEDEYEKVRPVITEITNIVSRGT